MASLSSNTASAACSPAASLGLEFSARQQAREFDRLFQAYQEGLRGFLSRRLFSAEEVEDALAQTFCNAWRGRETYRGEAAASTWLYQIAHRVALDRLRAMRRRPSVELDALPDHTVESLGEGAPDPAGVVADGDWLREARGRIDAALQRLAPEEAELVRLHYFQGCNYDEISARMGINRSQVKGRLHRVRTRLQWDLVHRQGWSPLSGDSSFAC